MKRALRGITWDDPRGWGPMPKVGEAFALTPEGEGVTIHWDIQPLEGFESRPIVELAKTYDLIVIDHPHVGDVVATGCLAPFADVADEYVGPSLRSYEMNGRCWALPVDAACQAAAYHPERVKRVPRTHAEVLDFARHGRVAAALVGVHALMALLSLLAQAGHPLRSERRDGLPSIEHLQVSAERLREIAGLMIPESLHWNPIQLLTAIVAGHCDYAPFTFAYVNFQKQGLRFVPLPTPGLASSHGAVLGGTGMAVSAGSPNLETAQVFARFAASAPIQTGIWPQHGGQSAHRTAWQRLAGIDPFYHELGTSIAQAYLRPRFAGWPELQMASGLAINEWLARRTQPSIQLAERLHALWHEPTDPSN